MDSRFLLTDISVRGGCTLREAMKKMDASGHGVLLLVSEDNVFLRTVTDGDLRRLALGKGGLGTKLSCLPLRESITLKEGSYNRRQALALMGEHSIHHLPVVDSQRRVVDLLDRKALDEQILLSTPHLGDAEREFVEEAFRTNWIAPLGPNVDAFEQEFADLVGVRHAAAVSSGTAAIHLALRVLGVGVGDSVFCSALTFVASANPILYQGAVPVFIDSEPDSWNMSPLALERAFDDARSAGCLPKAVIVVNLYGQSADMDPLRDICERHRVPLVEDAAESLGAFYKKRPSGTLGQLGIYSFNGNKIITTSGGGMLVSDDEPLIREARFLATQAREPVAHYEHRTLGYNYRMSNVLAGVGRGQLRVLGDRVEARRHVFERYRQGLAEIDAIAWMGEPAWSRSNRWLTAGVIIPGARSPSVALLMSKLADELIEARPVWKPMQLQPLFSGCRYYPHRPDDSVSERLFANGFCLPSGSNLTCEQQDRVIGVLRAVFGLR